MDENASPKSSPDVMIPPVESIPSMTLNFPTPEEEARYQNWIKLSTICSTEPNRGKEPVRRKARKRVRKPIVMHPFASFEETEFCVKTLQALSQGKPPPVPVGDQIKQLEGGFIN